MLRLQACTITNQCIAILHHIPNALTPDRQSDVTETVIPPNTKSLFSTELVKCMKAYALAWNDEYTKRHRLGLVARGITVDGCPLVLYYENGSIPFRHSVHRVANCANMLINVLMDVRTAIRIQVEPVSSLPHHCFYEGDMTDEVTLLKQFLSLWESQRVRTRNNH